MSFASWVVFALMLFMVSFKSFVVDSATLTRI